MTGQSPLAGVKPWLVPLVFSHTVNPHVRGFVIGFSGIYVKLSKMLGCYGRKREM